MLQIDDTSRDNLTLCLRMAQLAVSVGILIVSIIRLAREY